MKQSTKPHEASTDPLIGQTLGGKYSIVRLIGRGGVGLVYLARQAEPPRDVVVKVLAPHWADDPEALKRFDREAKRLRGLNHPNIVEMLGFGHDGERAYLVMEYLQGELLSDHVARKRRLTLEEFVPIAAQILKGIGHAHSRELMVRDVKPANVMLCERKGRANFVKILDFGLAKLLRGEQAITEEHVMGTVGYLAPEAIKGEPIDLRVDVYAIGVLFYYMLAGRLPFEGESNAAVFYKTINEQPRDLAELLGQNVLPRGLVDLVHSCLEKDRNNRPADADRIVEKLIDVVPSSLFRLPRAATERHGVPITLAPGAGNTGMMELLSVDRSPSHELPLEPGTPTPPPGTLRPVSSPLPAAVHETGRSALINVDALDGSRRTMSVVAISVIAGALAAILVVGALLLIVRDPEPKDVAVAGAPAPTAVASEASGLLASLDEIDARIGRGDLDGAAAALDRIRGQAKDDPAAFARVELAEKQIRVARLLADAAARETEGDTAAALVAYRDILALDPKHAPARAALARLEAPAAEVPATPLPPGMVQISARPSITNLYIDGVSVGTTPYRGELRPGRHKLKITARGYQTWEGSIDVAEEGTPPLAVTLRGKGSGKSGPDPSPASTPAPVPSTSPTPPPTSPPATAPAEPARQPEKKDPFLPTKPTAKPGSKDDPFLPVKKP